MRPSEQTTLELRTFIAELRHRRVDAKPTDTCCVCAGQWRLQRTIVLDDNPAVEDVYECRPGWVCTSCRTAQHKLIVALIRRRKRHLAAQLDSLRA